MKKVLSTVLSTAMLLSLAGCSSKENGKYTAGTYTGSGKGHSSDVKVTATFSTSEITKVELDVSGETESIGGVASEELQKQIMEKVAEERSKLAQSHAARPSAAVPTEKAEKPADKAPRPSSSKAVSIDADDFDDLDEE